MRIAAWLVATSAMATSPVQPAELADPEAVTSMACEGQVAGVLSSELLAEAVLVSSGVPASRVLALLPGEGQSQAAYLAKARSLVRDPSALGDKAAGQVLANTQRLVQAYQAGSLSMVLQVTGLPAQQLTRDTLFADNAGLVLTCLKATEAKVPIASRSGGQGTGMKTANSLQPRLIIRKSVEDLGPSSSDGIEGAGSFSFGFNRTKTITDEGARKRDTDLQINGAVGIALGSPSAGTNRYVAYAEYTRSTKRSKLNPPPADPAEQGEDDIDVLEVGVAAPRLLAVPTFGSGLFWEVRGRTAYVADFAKDARRVYGNLSFEPGIAIGALPGPIGFGAFGRDLGYGPLKFRLRARGWAEVELSHVLRKGTSDLDKGDELVGAGGTLRFDLAPKLFAKHGPIASAQYRRLWMIGGSANNLSRWDLEAGYRFLIASRLALDLKTTYAFGEERKSYDDEDIWKIEIGLKL